MHCFRFLRHLMIFSSSRSSAQSTCIRSSSFRPSSETIRTSPTHIRSFTTSSNKLESTEHIGNDNATKARFKPEYMPLEDIEPIERYRPGGFHPITIGDQLHNNQYNVDYKLGHGGYSTTWLARDKKHDKYVAIKITAADAIDNFRESKILHYLDSANKKNTGCGEGFFPRILDEFVHTGPNGKHRCLVMLPGRTSLIEAKDASYYRLFQPCSARSIIAQLIQAVDFLHSREVVHADLHLGNVLLRLPKTMDSLSPEELYEKYNEPYLEPISRFDGQPLPPGVPTHGIVPVWLGIDSEDVSLHETRIILSDFGESFFPSATQRHISKTPPLLVPPEVRFSPQSSLSYPADMWALACAIWEILGQRPLFESFFPSEDRVTAEHVEVLGKMPTDWWEKWENRAEWFNVEGGPEEVAEGSRETRSWEERFEFCIQKPRREKRLEVIGEQEKVALFSLLSSMLSFKPEERATMKDILDSKWMKEWALPDLRQMEELERNVTIDSR